MSSQSILADQELKEFGYEPKLSRSLTTWQLTAFGLTYLQPIGPAVIFGFLLATSGGSVALPYMLAFVGMIFTILSYSVLIKEYPLSGSIYNYVKYVISPFWGFIAGWLLALDYILIPTITSVSSAIYAHQLVPAVSYEAWLLFFVLSMGTLNLIGIKSTSYINSAILFIQVVIVLAGFVIWANYLMSETGNVFSMNYKIRDIFLSLSIIIDHFANDIFKHEKIKQIKNFDCVIKKLAELKLITKKQSKFLNDFRETRNLLTHQKVYSKVYFGGKPLLIRARLRAIIKEVCDIIVRLENKSKLKSKFNYRLIYQLLLDDLKLENNYKKKTSA